MRLKLAMMSAMATLTLTIGIAISAPTGAQAITGAHPTVAAGVSAAAQGRCSSHAPSGAAFEFWNRYNKTGDSWFCACNPGTEFSSGFLPPVKSFDNFCGTKVWMQQFLDGGSPPHGWSYCISPGATKNMVGTKYQSPASFLVGRQTGSC